MFQLHLTTSAATSLSLSFPFLFTVKETDRLSVVTYDTYVYVNFALMQMNKANKKEAKALVDSIRSGSMTNLCGGLLKGTLYIFVAVCKNGDNNGAYYIGH